MMKRWVIVSAALMVLFLLESSLFPWIIPYEWRNEMQLFPRITVVGVIFVGALANRHAGVLFGVIFGLIQDIVFYGHMIGPNAFTFALSGYAAGLLMKTIPMNLFTVLMAQVSGLLLFEASLYALYRLFRVTEMHFTWIFLNGMLPSLLVDLLFALILYIPARKWFEPSLPGRQPNEN